MNGFSRKLGLFFVPFEVRHLGTYLLLVYKQYRSPVAARSKASVCGRSPAEIVGSNPTGGMDVCLL